MYTIRAAQPMAPPALPGLRVPDEIGRYSIRVDDAIKFYIDLLKKIKIKGIQTMTFCSFVAIYFIYWLIGFSVN